MFLPIRARVFVVQAVFTGNKRRAIRHSGVIAALRAAHQSPQPVGEIGVAPAEVIQDGNLIRVCAHSDHVAQRLIHRRPSHQIRVLLAVARAQTIAQNHARNGLRPQRLVAG